MEIANFQLLMALAFWKSLAVQHWSVQPAWTSLQRESLLVLTESHPQKNN